MQSSAAIQLPLDDVDELKQQVRTLTIVRDQQKLQIDDLGHEIFELRRALHDREYRTRLLGTCIDDLARVRRLIRSDDKADAIYELEKVLSIIDSGWRQYA